MKDGLLIDELSQSLMKNEFPPDSLAASHSTTTVEAASVASNVSSASYANADRSRQSSGTTCSTSSAPQPDSAVLQSAGLLQPADDESSFDCTHPKRQKMTGEDVGQSAPRGERNRAQEGPEGEKLTLFRDSSKTSESKTPEKSIDCLEKGQSDSTPERKESTNRKQPDTSALDSFTMCNCVGDQGLEVGEQAPDRRHSFESSSRAAVSTRTDSRSSSSRSTCKGVWFDGDTSDKLSDDGKTLRELFGDGIIPVTMEFQCLDVDCTELAMLSAICLFSSGIERSFSGLNYLCSSEISPITIFPNLNLEKL